MSWSLQILFFVYATSGLVVALAARRWRRQVPLISLNLGLIAGTALCQATLGTAAAATLGGGLLLMQMAWVRLGIMGINLCMRRQRYDLAAALNLLLRPLLSPSRRAPTAMFTVYQRLEAGDVPGALRRLHEEGLHTPEGRYCRTLAYRLEGDSAGMCLWLELGRMSGWTREDPGYGVVFLSCEGEVHGIVRALARWRELAPEIRRDGGRHQLNRARLLLLAQAGDVDRLAALAEVGAMEALPPVEQALRLATALQVAGATERAERFLATQPPADVVAEYFLAQRRAQPLPPLQRPLAAAVEDSLTELYRESWLAATYRGIGGRLQKAPATAALLIVAAALAGLSARMGGVTDSLTLHRLGALEIIPDMRLPLGQRLLDSIQGQPWRLITANLLHYGWPHLIANSIGLAIFGPFTERFLGTWRMAAVYAFAGVGAMASVVLAVNTGHLGTHAIVGASAALTGAVGAGLVIAARGWHSHQSPEAARLLAWFAALIALQGLLDAYTPQTSSTAHLAGLVLGALVALLLHRVPEPPPIPGGYTPEPRESSPAPVDGA